MFCTTAGHLLKDYTNKGHSCLVCINSIAPYPEYSSVGASITRMKSTVIKPCLRLGLFTNNKSNLSQTHTLQRIFVCVCVHCAYIIMQFACECYRCIPDRMEDCINTSALLCTARSLIFCIHRDVQTAGLATTWTLRALQSTRIALSGQRDKMQLIWVLSRLFATSPQNIFYSPLMSNFHGPIN